MIDVIDPSVEPAKAAMQIVIELIRAGALKSTSKSAIGTGGELKVTTVFDEIEKHFTEKYSQ